MSTKHDEDLLVIGEDPLNAESPPEAFEHAVTPTRNTYVRSNFAIPALDVQHQVSVGGAVARPFTLGLDELRRMARHTLTATMECAGNDRTRMEPRPVGEPWRTGAVSTSRWSGVPLRDLLRRAEIAADAREVVVTGADSGERLDVDHPVAFARSVPLDDALAPDTILALTMNGEAIPPMHGAPVRLVVPGWYGMASVKWVTGIEVITGEYRGYFQRQRYVYDDESTIRPVTRMLVKSAIVSPSPDERVRTGLVTAWGWAWSGEGPITAVEVSTSTGEIRLARLESPVSPHAWTRWEVELALPSLGRCFISSRATDASGASQPDGVAWNRLGYGNNAVRTVWFDLTT
jgi:DMSO/TMAO reductase YedYZ molybdopterin-dependent catalytic subunit